MRKAHLIILALMLTLTTLPAKADEPEIIYIEVEKQILLDPPTMKREPCQIYEWDDETIDAVASVYWAETGANGPTTAREKLAITQLIWNRTQYGSPFPSTIVEVCKQKNEFNRGRVSDRNRQIARDNLNIVRSQAEGHYQGIDPNLTMAIYMTREGGTGILTFQDPYWVTVYRVERG